MICEEVRELSDLYVDGELSEEAQSRLERHLIGCAACAYEIRSREQVRSLLKESLAHPHAAPGFRERILARFSRTAALLPSRSDDRPCQPPEDHQRDESQQQRWEPERPLAWAEHAHGQSGEQGVRDMVVEVDRRSRPGPRDNRPHRAQTHRPGRREEGRREVTRRAASVSFPHEHRSRTPE